MSSSSSSSSSSTSAATTPPYQDYPIFEGGWDKITKSGLFLPSSDKTNHVYEITRLCTGTGKSEKTTDIFTSAYVPADGTCLMAEKVKADGTPSNGLIVCGDTAERLQLYVRDFSRPIYVAQAAIALNAAIGDFIGIPGLQGKITEYL